MSLITIMKGIPLYTTKKEALNWAISNKLKGCHTHTFKNQRGYMGGSTHKIAMNRTNYTTIQTSFNSIPPTQLPQPTPPVVPIQITRPQPITQPAQTTEPIRRTTPVRTTSGGGSSSGGGGGGGGY